MAKVYFTSLESGVWNNSLKIKGCTFAGNVNVYGDGILFNGANLFDGTFTVEEDATEVVVTGEAHFNGEVNLKEADTIIRSGPYFHNDLTAYATTVLEDVKFAAKPNRQTARFQEPATLTNVYFDEGVAQTIVQAHKQLTLDGNIVGNPDFYGLNSSRDIMDEWHQTTKIISLLSSATPIFYQGKVNVSDVVIETSLTGPAPFNNSAGLATTEAVFENVYFADDTDDALVRTIDGNENSFVGTVFYVKDGNTGTLGIIGAENYFEDVTFMPEASVGTAGEDGTKTIVVDSTFQATVTVNTPANQIIGGVLVVNAPSFGDTDFQNDLVVTNGKDAIYQGCLFKKALTLYANSDGASFLDSASRDSIFEDDVTVNHSPINFGNDEGAGNQFNGNLVAGADDLVFYNSVFAIDPEPAVAPLAPNTVSMNSTGTIYFQNVDILYEDLLTRPQWVFNPRTGTIRVNGQINNLRDDNFEMGNTAANYVEANYPTTGFAVGDALDPEGNTWPTHVNELNVTIPIP